MDEFDNFWKLYPRKIAKKHALQMWKRLTKAQQDKALETIGNHIQQWAKELRADDKIPTLVHGLTAGGLMMTWPQQRCQPTRQSRSSAP